MIGGGVSIIIIIIIIIIGPNRADSLLLRERGTRLFQRAASPEVSGQVIIANDQSTGNAMPKPFSPIAFARINRLLSLGYAVDHLFKGGVWGEFAINRECPNFCV